MCDNINLPKQKTAIIILLIALVAFPNIVSATDELTEINANSPYQVKPGTSLPIYITVNHRGDIENISVSPNSEISSLINSLETKGLIDRITIDSIEIFDPTIINESITEPPLLKNKVKISHQPNAKLNSIGGALQAKQKIESLYFQKLKEIEKSNLTKEEKSQRLNKTFSEYQGYKQSLQNLIRKGKYHNITLLKFPENFPEGDVGIPVRITYTREKNGVKTQDSVVKTLTVTVTSTIQPKRAIIIDIDALKRDALENALPNMPYTKTYITDVGVRFTDAKTVFPSITMAAQASIYTGNYPANHSITGNAWFEKSTQTYRDYWVGTWYEDVIWSEGRANEDMSNNVDTIYEREQTMLERAVQLFLINIAGWVLELQDG